jgi:transposase/cell division protein FtsB
METVTILKVELDALFARLDRLEKRCEFLENRCSELEKRNAYLEARNQELEKRNAYLEAKNQELEARNKELELQIAYLTKNSSNSSKPPSSDSSGKGKGKGKGKNSTGRTGKNGKPGAKPGHEKNEREPFEKVDDEKFYGLECCPDCGGSLSLLNRDGKLIQQVELVEKPVIITNHIAGEYCCNNCQKNHMAKLPDSVEKGSLFGPAITAFTGWLKGACHCSYQNMSDFFRDVFGIKVSKGFLAKMVTVKCSSAINPTYEDLLQNIKNVSSVNVDETGHKENGNRMWTWTFRAGNFVLFKIDESRGSSVLIDVLGQDFRGVLGSDFFSAYRKYMNLFGVEVQFCIAHLIRELVFLTNLNDTAVVRYGRRLLDEVKELFYILGDKERLDDERMKELLEAQSFQILAVANENVPQEKHAQNIRNRFLRYGENYFKFITTPGIDPTNNIAEQAIRFVVIDRLITQGTRSEKGRNWCERIWSIKGTCRIQKRSCFDFLVEAVKAFFNGESPPFLLPAVA